MPAVLVEVGFIDSNVDNRLFDDNFDDIAQAIASGILDTLESVESYRTIIIGPGRLSETAGMRAAAE